MLSTPGSLLAKRCFQSLGCALIEAKTREPRIMARALALSIDGRILSPNALLQIEK
ncbi:hypothetical protein [Kushneria phosphatilytica]|uniref:hypothetical protein n=1 Tax=Kushneria phosphatilytica TaxID=657387 RepID=UPI00143B625C|nr:hypothetical protein [Kushneria phosphatilytica]